MDQEIRVPEFTPYGIRIKKQVRLYLIISAVIIISCGIKSAWLFGACCASLYFSILYFQFVAKQRFYITRVLVDNNLLSLFYKEKNEEKIITGATSDFKFKIGNRYSPRRVCLKIFYNEKLFFKQYLIGVWDIDRFRQLVSFGKN